MKTKKVWFVTMLLIMGFFATDLMAQETLDALVKKIETMEGVNVSIVRQRDPKTRKLTQTITSFKIEKTNTSLLNELFAAFEKDKGKAIQEIENKSNGVVKSYYYEFDKVSYSLSNKKEGAVSVSIIRQGEE